MENNGAVTQTRLKHDLNQQQDLNLGHKLNMWTLKLKYAKAMGAKGYSIGKQIWR
jgi:hypothetical protein